MEAAGACEHEEGSARIPQMFFDTEWLRREHPLHLVWAAGTLAADSTAQARVRGLLKRYAHAIPRCSLPDLWYVIYIICSMLWGTYMQRGVGQFSSPLTL